MMNEKVEEKKLRMEMRQGKFCCFQLRELQTTKKNSNFFSVDDEQKFELNSLDEKKSR